MGTIGYHNVEQLLLDLGWTQNKESPSMWEILVGGQGGTYPTTIELNSEVMKALKLVYEMGRTTTHG